jgi:hypothetical protein
MQQDTLDPPGNTTADDPQHGPHESPYANLGRKGEEITSPAHRHGENPRGATNNELGPGLSIEDEQVIAQPHFHEAGGEEGYEGDKGDEEDEEREEVEEVQMEQTEGEGEDDTRRPARANDKWAEDFDMRVMKQNSEQDEEELQQSGRQESRLSNSPTSDNGINDTSGTLALEGSDDTQGRVDRSSTPAVIISSSDVDSTLEQETEREKEPGQVTSDDRVKHYANATEEQS